MKKVFLWFLSILMIMSTAACSKQPQNNKAAVGSSNQADDSSTGTISIALQTKDRLIESAVKKFEAQNPGVKVDLKVYTTEVIEEKGDIAISKPQDGKYLSTINTEIMAGRGEDIIFANKLPYTKYADKKLFADISKIMEADKDFDKNKYFYNLFDALKYSGGLYIMPIDYCVEMISMEAGKDGSSKSAVNDSKWNWDDFIKAGKDIMVKSGKKYVICDTDKDVFDNMMRYSYKSFVDTENKKAKFDSDKFKDMLNYCKGLSDKGITVKESDMGNLKGSPMVFYPDIASAWQEFGDLNPKSAKIAQYKYPSNDGSGKLSFYSTQVYAINNNSKKKNLAWKFIKYLLSDDIQSSVEMAGLPVNKAAVRKQGENIIKTMKDELSKNGTNISDDAVSQRLDKYVEKINNITKNVDRYNKMDPTIQDIIYKETESFFGGKESAEDTAKTIQNKVSTYLKEQK